MRRVASSLALIPLLAAIFAAVPERPAAAQTFSSAEKVMEWMYNYRRHPAPDRLPQAVKAMRETGLFTDDEKAGFCIGFIAGVLANNHRKAPTLVAKMFPMPPKEQAVIIKGIAYSGLPDWKELLTKYRDKMPMRQHMVEDFLNDKKPTLMHIPLSDGAGVIYVLWGYYVATGDYMPVVRIMSALQWSSDKDEGFKIANFWKGKPRDVEKATIGGTAKWTLASYAERDRELLNLYRAEYTRQPEKIARALRDIVIAAERYEAEEIREQEMKAIEEVQRRHLTDPNGMSKAATAGSVGIATACVAAGAAGLAYVAVPCVIGGAVYTGAVRLLSD